MEFLINVLITDILVYERMALAGEVLTHEMLFTGCPGLGVLTVNKSTVYEYMRHGSLGNIM